MDDAFVGLPGREMQWVFDKRRRSANGASHLSLVSSGADATWSALDDDALIALAAREVAEAIPGRAGRGAPPRHRHPREARDVLAGARPAGPARRARRPSTACFSPATGSTPAFPAQSRAPPRRPHGGARTASIAERSLERLNAVEIESPLVAQSMSALAHQTVS